MLLSGARAELASGQYETALQLLAEAGDTRHDGQVRGLVARTKMLQLTAAGEEAERKGDPAGAIRLYESALGMEENAHLREHIAELKNRIRLRGPAH